MPQLFPPYLNTVVRVALGGAALGLVSLGGAMYAGFRSPWTTEVGMAKHQRVPFSHEHHVAGLGIDCRYCHTSVEVSASAGMPPTETCMTCHSQVWKDAPLLAPVRESWSTGQPMRWNRVHDLPDYTYFNHSIHVAKGVACVSCHGRVDTMPLVWKEHSLYMRWCLECHNAPEKNLQPKEAIFTMQDLQPNSPERGAELARAYHLRPTEHLADCSICHR